MRAVYKFAAPMPAVCPALAGDVAVCVTIAAPMLYHPWSVAPVWAAAGPTPRFPNADAILHDACSLSRTQPFDRGFYSNIRTSDVVEFAVSPQVGQAVLAFARSDPSSGPSSARAGRRHRLPHLRSSRHRKKWLCPFSPPGRKCRATSGVLNMYAAIVGKGGPRYGRPAEDGAGLLKGAPAARTARVDTQAPPIGERKP
jgi:hypothetical protein